MDDGAAAGAFHPLAHYRSISRGRSRRKESRDSAVRQRHCGVWPTKQGDGNGKGPTEGWRRWGRQTISYHPEADKSDVLTTLSFLEADRMVVGHTPFSANVKRCFADKLLIIDVAMSRWMRNHPPSLLEIHEPSKRDVELEGNPTSVSIIRLGKDGSLPRRRRSDSVDKQNASSSARTN